MFFATALILSLFFLICSPFQSESASPSIKGIRPSCRAFGWPPRVFLFAQLSSTDNKIKLFTYNGHYCCPNQTQFCFDPKIGYEQMNCTASSSEGVVLVKCNATEIVEQLYSQSKLTDNRLCLRISASNQTNTVYSKRKCCGIQESSKMPPIRDLKLHASSKREINITWSSPSNIDISTKGFLVFLFYVTMPDYSYINKTITVRPSKWRSSHFSHTITNLEPYTRYHVSGVAYLVDPSEGININAEEIRTLPEAPSVPPTITENRIISQNKTDRNVRVKWKHPPVGKRNGQIYQTVIKYQSGTSHVNNSLPYNKLIVNGTATEATIEGLVKTARYVMVVKSCTSASSVDCSKPSNEVSLQGIPPKTQPLTKPGGFKINSLAFILSIVFLAVVSGIFSVILLAYCLRKQSRRDTARHADSPSTDNLPEDITVVHDDSDPEPQQEQCDEYAHVCPPVYSYEEGNHDEATKLQMNENYYGEELDDIPLC